MVGDRGVRNNGVAAVCCLADCPATLFSLPCRTVLLASVGLPATAVGWVELRIRAGLTFGVRRVGARAGCDSGHVLGAHALERARF
eukprot:8167603-Alexandrium_andersonii.AAC.1